MGKLSPEDHRQLQNEYMQEASVVLDRIERSANGKHQIGAQIEQAVLEIRKRRVVAGSQGTGSPAPVTVSSPVSAQKSACPSCGAENPEEANFCNECGVSLRQTVACGACGAENRSGARFCGQCGQKMA
jgi:ribosomal protein L40E